MINLGRLGIFNFGPALLAGFSLFGMIHVAPLHWKWLFWGPSIVCAIVAIAMAFGVKETPEENGFLPVEDYTPAPPSRAVIIRRCIIGSVHRLRLWLHLLALPQKQNRHDGHGSCHRRGHHLYFHHPTHHGPHI